jgi:thiol-disulfide isomerase/thioredoxin
MSSQSLGHHGFSIRRVLACAVVTLSSLAVLYAQEVNQTFEQQLGSAKSLLASGKAEEAIKSFKQANRLMKDASTECYFGLAAAYLQLNAYKNVLESSDQIIRLAKDNIMRAGGHNIKGVALTALANGKLEKLKDAEQEFRSALLLAGAPTVVHHNLGVALLKEGRDPEGIEELKRYLVLAPKGKDAHLSEQLIENPRRARESFAPEYTFTTSRGEYISFEEFVGKVVLLDFWASWCGPCVQAVPDLRRFYKRYPKDRFVLISISSDTDEERWKTFIAKNKMEWPQYRDADHHLFRVFKVGPIPNYVVIDGEGIVARVLVGWNYGQASLLESTIEKSLRTMRK